MLILSEHKTKYMNDQYLINSGATFATFNEQNLFTSEIEQTLFVKKMCTQDLFQASFSNG